MSRIVTFYSYKGGVGRTLALANIGILLARKGKRVLLMDWDLEAPGLDRYFRPYQPKIPDQTQGVAQLLRQAADDSNADWRSHVQKISVRPQGDQEDCKLSFIPSGVAAPDYAELVRSFSWGTFLGDFGGGPTLERWRFEWKEAFDLVLIDSRTGITDSGGICTILLPDFLVLVFTANEQSYEGTLAIAASAQVERRKLAVQRPPLTLLPLLSRFDRRDELAESEKWLGRFAAGLAPMYADWLPKQYSPLQILEITKVPYVTRFSFGEPLPVLTHSITDPELPGFYLENCARLLASDFSEAARIVDPTAPEPHAVSDQIRSLLQRAPIDDQDLDRMLRAAGDELGDGIELGALLGEVGSMLIEQSRLSAAEQCFRRALALNEEAFGPDHPDVARHLNNLAQILQETNRLAEAEHLVRRALAINQRSFGPDHPNVARDLNTLAALLRDTNRSVETKPRGDQAPAIGSGTINVLIVDPHALFRAGLRMILKEQDRIEVVGEANSGEDALLQAKRLVPNVCLMELNMPAGMGGIEATRRLRRVLPDCRVIAMITLAEGSFPGQLREAGAMGYLTKGCPADELVEAIRAVAAGRPYVDSSIAQARMLADWQGGPGSPFAELSSRELQVAMMILSGRHTQDISESLSLSPKTVSTYRQRIYERLGVQTDVDLTRLAFRHGLISDLCNYSGTLGQNPASGYSKRG